MCIHLLCIAGSEGRKHLYVLCGFKLILCATAAEPRPIPLVSYSPFPGLFAGGSFFKNVESSTAHSAPADCAIKI